MSKYAVVRIIDDNDTPLWAAFVERYRAHAKQTKAASTVRCSEAKALDLFGIFAKGKRLDEITPERADAWQQQLSMRYAQNTVRRRLLVISGVFRYAQTLGIITSNPFDMIALPNQVFGGRTIADKELADFLLLLPLDIRRACQFILYTGLRRSEILSLDWQDVGADTLTVTAAKAKSRRARVISLHPKAKALLRARRQSGRVFKFGEWRFNSQVTRAWRKAGHGRIRIHDLRHVWATRLLETPGADIFLAMEQGGWASTRSMLPYQHITAGRREAILRMRYRF